MTPLIYKKFSKVQTNVLKIGKRKICGRPRWNFAQVYNNNPKCQKTLAHFPNIWVWKIQIFEEISKFFCDLVLPWTLRFDHWGLISRTLVTFNWTKMHTQMFAQKRMHVASTKLTPRMTLFCSRKASEESQIDTAESDLGRPQIFLFPISLTS